MNCDCHSYNRNTGSVPEVVCVNPATGERVSIDSCIAPIVALLWAEGVSTGGSCCGHGTSAPSVVLCDAADADRARKLLSHHAPGRRFEISAWVRAVLAVSE